MKPRNMPGRSKQSNDASQVSRVTLITGALALLIGLLHSQHLYHLFENDRYFSALSSLERDLSFRTEMGLYYSYYKTIVEADTFSSGINELLYDNITEYPSTINTMKRFNLYPEVVLGGSFRFVSELLKRLEVKSDCYDIQRGYNQPPIRTCKGLGEPHYFYVYFIFGLNSLLPVSIFLLSVYLSEGLLGGIISVLMFFYNHGEATRVMWTPPLRESFAMPFLFLQFLIISYILRKSSVHVLLYVAYGVVSLLFLLPWQFAQFTLLTQALCLLGVYSLRVLQRNKFLALLITLGSMLLLNALLQFGNALLLTSYFAFFIPSCLLVVALRPMFNLLRWPPLIAVCEVISGILLSLVLKTATSNLIGVKDDAHIGAILLSKFTSYQDFHTQLYTCAAEFDFLSYYYLVKLTITLLIPIVLMVVGNVIWQVFLFVFNINGICESKAETAECEISVNKTKTKPKPVPSGKIVKNNSLESPLKAESNELEVSLVYNTFQCLAFAVMAILIMRLKLFLTPLMSVLAGLVTSNKVLKSISGNHRINLTYGLIVLCSIGGLWNLSDQMSIIGEYNNPDLEELTHWINTSTLQNSSFAGGMPVMATVKLTTKRPIVNHPHYEDSEIRRRTKLIYTLYSKRDPEVIYQNLRSLSVQYVILEDAWCNKQYRKGCAFHDVYLKEYPDDVSRPLFCLLIKEGIKVRHFKQVFKNKSFQVLQLLADD